MNCIRSTDGGSKKKLQRGATITAVKDSAMRTTTLRSNNLMWDFRPRPRFSKLLRRKQSPLFCSPAIRGKRASLVNGDMILWAPYPPVIEVCNRHLIIHERGFKWLQLLDALSCRIAVFFTITRHTMKYGAWPCLCKCILIWWYSTVTAGQYCKIRMKFRNAGRMVVQF